MRLLVVGADTPYAIERPYLRYLAEIKGVDAITLFPAQNIFLEYYRKNLTNKLLFRAGLSTIMTQINLRLKQVVAEFTPDIVWVFKGMEVLPETITWLKKRGVKVVNYNPDNPFIFSGRGSGNSNVTRSIGLFDLHLSYDKMVKRKIENDFGIDCHLLPFGFDLEPEVFEKAKRAEENVGVCFLGSADPYRAKFITQLIDRGVALDLYGNGWKKYLSSNTNVGIYNATYGEDFWSVLRQYRVQLNMMRPHNLQSHNMRTFEVPGVGGIELAPATIDHETYFEPGLEIIVYRDVDDCVDQINTLLSIPEREANDIRHKARVRSLNSGYTYKDRANQVFEILNRLI
ncbi:MAG: glycosyltransferase [Bacteroidetes bacterium]|nr:glycosyltransferase [Bacteroidota bacterium]